MMRLLDRYLSTLFLSATGLFLITLTALFILVDFVTKAESFFSLEQISFLPFLLKYYFLRMPIMLVYVLPMVTLFGAAFTLLRLSRTNELIPMVTSGVSIRRLAIPFLVVAMLCGIIVALLEEFMIPRISQELMEMDSVLVSKEYSWEMIAYDGENEYLDTFRYNHVKKELQEVMLVRIDPPNVIRFRLKAETGIWDPKEKRWIFRNGTLQRFDEKGNAILLSDDQERPVVAMTRFGEEGFSPETQLTPMDLQRTSFMTVPSTTLRRLRKKIRRHPEVPRFRQQFHSKLAFPFSSLVLLMIGFPFVVTMRSQGMIRGLFLCLIVSICYYGAHFACADLGRHGRFSPELAAWTPTVLFGIIGIVLFTRMKT